MPTVLAASALALCFALGPAVRAAGAAPALSRGKMVALLRQIDDRVRATGDYKALIYLESRARGRSDTAQEALVFRHDADDKLMILFTKPQSVAGTGYLRLDDNLWYYDPSTGHWDRRTDRERIAGTDSRREDFDHSDLAGEYDPAYLGEGKLGVYKVWHLRLSVKPDQNATYAIVELWIDEATGNYLKREDFALSGRLMRTSYVPKWDRLYSEAKHAYVWYPRQINIYDDIDKANSTVVAILKVDLSPLPENMFTKEWLESQSR